MITHEHDVAERARRQVRIVDGMLTEDADESMEPVGRHRESRATDRSIVAPSGMTIRDLANESLAGLFARPGRMVLTVLGTVIGLGALVATLGLSRTAGNRIVGRFDELAATEIVVSPKPSAIRPRRPTRSRGTRPTRLGRLNGVAAVGNLSTLNVGARLVASSPVTDPQNQTAFKLTVTAASPGLFRAVRRRSPHRRGARRRPFRASRTGRRARAERGRATRDHAASTNCRRSRSATTSSSSSASSTASPANPICSAR